MNGCVVCQLQMRDEKVNGIVIFVNCESMEFIGIYVVENGIVKRELTQSLSLYQQIIGLSDSGMRWEGSCCNNRPCGWGATYDDEGNLVFCGFRINNVNVCYGKYFYSDLHEHVEYEGMLCNNQYSGYGYLYDRNGAVVSKGVWIMSTLIRECSCRVMPYASLPAALHSLVTDITLDSLSCISSANLVLSALPRLEQLSIGDYCMCNKTTCTGMFALLHLNSLRMLHIGIGSCVFFSSIQLCDLPLLEEVYLGMHAFMGNQVASALNDEMPIYPNRLEMRGGVWREDSPTDLPSLRLLQDTRQSFKCIGYAYIHSGSATLA